jgi:hypothetical protein
MVFRIVAGVVAGVVAVVVARVVVGGDEVYQHHSSARVVPRGVRARQRRLKDRNGEPEGGSEWEPIKILLQELDLGPKVTSKDLYTNLPRSRSHNGPTDPRNKLEQA